MRKLTESEKKMEQGVNKAIIRESFYADQLKILRAAKVLDRVGKAYEK